MREILRSLAAGPSWAAWLLVCCLVPGPARAAGTVRIAVAAPLTGSYAAAGEDIKAGVLLLVETVNAAGGLAGATVEPVFYDDLCEPREAANVAAAIARDPAVLGVVGHVCSSAHLAALPTYLREGVAAVTPTATSVVISARNRDEDGHVWSFRTIYRDDYQGKFLAKYMAKALGLRKVALLYENNDYGLGLKKSFLKQARRRGLAVVAVEAYKKGDLDFTALLTKMKSAGPQGLFIAGYYAEAALIANQAATVGLAVPKFGADALDSPDFLRLAGPAAENTFMTAPAFDVSPDSAGSRFTAAFAQRFGREADWMNAYAYDAAGVLLAAAAKAGPDRAKIRAALAAMRPRAVGYAGVAGPIAFDASGDCLRSAFVKTVKNGAFVAAPQQLE
ncbi:ABC transporter substrate-binding protein [Solidesulfovibrio sp.]|uniref:ABC transporter substrate-binding protein n=1 Tax=Solidesulfovibrio sp. TaxID=2910990 RepID=UPI002B212D15|nr:ABC transporter substrate-binding protein [Solidesulfovibrio sp.]MEA4855759.1 ABC transporter substrate-binding protein [Solidesulfovibrio sp.]